MDIKLIAYRCSTPYIPLILLFLRITCLRVGNLMYCEVNEISNMAMSGILKLVLVLIARLQLQIVNLLPQMT